MPGLESPILTPKKNARPAHSLTGQPRPSGAPQKSTPSRATARTTRRTFRICRKKLWAWFSVRDSSPRTRKDPKPDFHPAVVKNCLIVRPKPLNSKHFSALFLIASTNHFLLSPRQKMLMPLMLRPGKSISKETLTRGHFMKKLHPAKMNGFNSISLAAKFDAVISRHRQKLYPQTAGNLTLSKSPPPPTHPQLATVGGFENGSL